MWTSLIAKQHTVLGFFIIFLLSCGPGPKVASTETAQDKATVPANLTVTSISYYKNQASSNLFPPYTETISLAGDFASGSCLGATSQITILGTFDSTNASSVMMTGLISTQTLTGSNFKFVACLSQGATAVTLTSYNSDGVGNPAPTSLSFNLTSVYDTSIKTIGSGHPRYPNPGFDLSGLNLPSGQLTSGDLTLKVGFTGTAATGLNSTGNTSLTMDMGYANILKQTNP